MISRKNRNGKNVLLYRSPFLKAPKEMKVCLFCKIKYRENKSVKRFIGFCSRECKSQYHIKIQKTVEESNNFYDSREWLDIRYRVLVKYGRECMCCGKTKGVMNVDHIKPRSLYPELALEFDNLQVLCPDCNTGKSNKYFDDLRNKQIALKNE